MSCIIDISIRIASKPSSLSELIIEHNRFEVAGYLPGNLPDTEIIKFLSLYNIEDHFRYYGYEIDLSNAQITHVSTLSSYFILLPTYLAIHETKFDIFGKPCKYVNVEHHLSARIYICNSDIVV